MKQEDKKRIIYHEDADKERFVRAPCPVPGCGFTFSVSAKEVDFVACSEKAATNRDTNETHVSQYKADLVDFCTGIRKATAYFQLGLCKYPPSGPNAVTLWRQRRARPFNALVKHLMADHKDTEQVRARR